MTAKIRKDLSDKSRNVYQAGPWFVSVNKTTGNCQTTSGDVWFDIPRAEARALLLRKVG